MQGILSTHFAGRMPFITLPAAGRLGVLRLQQANRYALGLPALRMTFSKKITHTECTR